MPADTAVRVRGMRELSAAFARTDRDTRLGLRKAFRQVAEPVRRDAQQLALSEITGMARSPRWAGMRTGVTRKLVYVAPRQKGARGDRRRRRPNLAGLLMERAMEPALERHEPLLEQQVEQLLDHIADNFNRGGAL